MTEAAASAAGCRDAAADKRRADVMWRRYVAGVIERSGPTPHDVGRLSAELCGPPARVYRRLPVEMAAEGAGAARG